MSSTIPPKNYHLAKVAGAKRVEIPFTINGGAVAAITATIDDELTNSAEIFVANSAGAAQDGIRGGAGGTAASLIDPSANDANSKAFPLLLSSDTAPASIGFIVADGTPDLRPSTIPSQDTPQNPGFHGTAASIKGAARKLFSAEVVFTDGAPASGAAGNIVTATGSTPAGTRGAALRAETLVAGVTPNGNIKVRVSLPKLVAASGTATLENAVPGFLSGTIKGFLQLTYI